MNINNENSLYFMVTDLNELHQKYGFHESVAQLSSQDLRTLMQFRLDFLKEELAETSLAIWANNSEEIVDGLIDLIYVAIGTLDLFDVDIGKAWSEVHGKNMQKERGIKKERPNPLGLPDLIKPEGWEAPSHKDNHGNLHSISSDKG